MANPLSSVKLKFELNKAAMLSEQSDFSVALLLDFDGKIHRVSTNITAVNGETVILGRSTLLPIDAIVGIDYQ